MSILTDQGGLLSVSAVALLSFIWQYQVSNTLSSPYLDEFFHIPQAQAYWAGLWSKWDPKITTPPGLYVYSYLSMKIIRTIGSIVVAFADDLHDIDLRFTNWLLYISFPFQLWNSYSYSQPQLNSSKRDPWFLSHSIFNICLFPLLFFFSGLYYTDILSTYMVVVTYNWYLYSLSASRGHKRLGRLMQFICGLAALSVRQTNVFWVAIFPAGLHVVETVRRHGSISVTGFTDVIKAAIETKKIYDPPVSGAGVEDYVKMILSLGIAAISSIPSLIFDIWPQLGNLIVFATFIAWNGGVVLGDKNNHIASLHIPQMLYIWPYITFFSWPMMVANITNDLSSLRVKLPSLLVASSSIALMLAAVKFNTVVHPFTLADNRHYVFYVFRILLLHPLIRYAAVPIYFTCAWAVLVALGGIVEGKKPRASKKGPVRLSDLVKADNSPVRVSFVLIWLVATTLSLVTAPLVEPRYFIIPWLFWRLQVPPLPTSATAEEKKSMSKTEQFALQVLRRVNWLWLETGWLLLVNLITCMMFLYRGFEWPQEPGQVQRFMW